MGGTLCKIGSPLLSFLLCSLCTPLQAMSFEQQKDLLENYLLPKIVKEKQKDESQRRATIDIFLEGVNNYCAQVNAYDKK